VEGTPASLQRLLTDDRELQDKETLSEFTACSSEPTVCLLRVKPDDSNLHLLEDLRRGSVKLHQLPSDLCNVESIALAALENDPSAFENVSRPLQGDRRFVLAALQCQRKNTSKMPLLAYVPRELLFDREVVWAAVRQDARSLQFAAEYLKGDRSLVLLAVQQCEHVLQFASRSLKADPELILTALGQLDLAYDVKDLSIASKKALEQISRNGEVLQHAPPALKADRDIVSAVLQWDGLALQYASAELRDDSEMVATAVRQNVSALQFASEQLRHDRSFAIILVTRHWQAFKYLPEKMRSERRVLVAAVKKSWHALKLAPPELQEDQRFLDADLAGDQDFMLAAIAQDAGAVKYASEGLQQDHSFVTNAVSVNGRCIRHLPSAWKYDSKVVLIAIVRICTECSKNCLKQTCCSLFIFLLCFATILLFLLVCGGLLTFPMSVLGSFGKLHQTQDVTLG